MPSRLRSNRSPSRKSAKLAKNETKKLLLVNLWATWCGPCVAELPEFVTMNRMYRESELQARHDQYGRGRRRKPTRSRRWPRITSRRRTTIFKIRDRDTFAEALDKEWPGPLPYTLLIAPGGKMLYRKSGPIDPLDVKRAIVAYLGRTY